MGPQTSPIEDKTRIAGALSANRHYRIANVRLGGDPGGMVLRLRKPSRRLVLTDPPYFMWMYDRLIGQLIAANCFSKSASSPIHSLRSCLVPICRLPRTNTCGWRGFSTKCGHHVANPSLIVEELSDPFVQGYGHTTPTSFPIAWRMTARTGSLCVPLPRAMNEFRNGWSLILPLTFTNPRVPKNLTESGQMT